MSTLRDKIAAAQQRGPVPFDSAALGGQRVHIKVLSGFETNAYWVSIKEKTAGQVQQMLVLRCLCDETGATVFAPGEVAEVAKLDNRFLEEIASEAQRVNCLTSRDVDRMRTDFFGQQANSGSSSSPAISASSTPTT
jgi:hypothetical protein